MPGATNNNKVEVTLIMRALEAEVFDADAVWEAVQPLLPPPDRSHPLGCHRPRISDRLCLRGLFIRLVTGSSWVDIEAILDHQVSDTTLRARRDEWIDAGVFDKLKDEALAAFDRIIELDLDDVAIDGSLHKAPICGEGTGPNPTDRGECGWKWSVAADGHGIRSAGPPTAPIATTSASCNQHLTPSKPLACTTTSPCSTSTAATTTPRPEPSSPPAATPISTSRSEAPSPLPAVRIA